MIYDPVVVVQSGELAFTRSGIVMRNWGFDMGGRPGEPSDYPCEILIAVRERIVANINARLLMMDDEQFGDARSHNAFVDQTMLAPGTFALPPKKRAWWRFWGA